MSTYDVWVDIDYYDAAERTSTRSYLLREKFDDTSTGNWEDVILAAEDVLTAVNILSWSSTPRFFVRMQLTWSGVPAIQANNQIAAFTRIYDDDDVLSSIEIPAWDDTIYDEDNRNIIDPAYNTAAAVLALLLRSPETGSNYALVPQFSQSRTRKSRNVING